MIGSFLRRILFWALDYIKGKPVLKAYKDIEKKTLEGYRPTYELNSIMEYAKKQVPFYKELVKDNDYLKEITDFPIMTKIIYKNNYNNFRSREYMNSRLYEMSTSGSTGTPFVVKMNSEKRKRVNAEFIYFNRIAGQKLGDRYMYLKTWKKKKSSIESFAQNVIAIDILKLDDFILEKIRRRLKNDYTINSILAYASTYEVLVDYLIRKGDEKKDFNIKGVFSSSTLMTKEMKNKLENLFGCPVYDRYSSQENGLLAQTEKGKEFFKINIASYYIELLNLKNNHPVKPGEVGRVVVTDLYNYAMPMIRYDTGDLAVSLDEDRSFLKTLQNLEGRRLDMIYDTKGNPLTPHIWSVHMRKYEKVLQWQFIQENQYSYRLSVSGNENDYTKEDFTKTLKDILGQDAKITIVFIDSIPVMASGKFKNTICLYNPEDNKL